MINNKLKKILLEITKEAQFQGVSKARVGGPSASTSSNSDYGGAGNLIGYSDKPTPANNTVPLSINSVVAIKNMQIAMQKLAESVIVDSTSAVMPAKPSDASPSVGSDQAKTSKKAFNDFIAEQYVGTLEDNNKGVEWTKDPTATKLPQKQETQTDIYELDVVMDTLRRIGMEKSEFKPDGRWQFRTDNALRNIMGFAYALLQLEGDFGLPNNIYQHTNLEDFNNLMSGYTVENGVVKLSSSEKEKRAIEITKHLNSITKLYNSFRNQVTARPEYRSVIEGRRAFDKYTNDDSNKLTSDQINMVNSGNAGTISIPINLSEQNFLKQNIKVKLSNEIVIPLNSLKNKEEYLKWASQNSLNEFQALYIFMNIIKPKIERM